MLAEPQQQTDFDTGPRSLGAGTERLCVVTRQVKPVDAMIRLVAGPLGQVVPDLKRKLPGRGVWVTATRAVLAQAAKGGLLTKAFGRPVTVAPDFVDATERLLERSALDGLAIAGKGRQAVSGFSKVETALARGQAVAVLHASDAAADGVRKVEAMRRQAESGGRRIVVFTSLSSAQLDLALGRPNVVHAALLAGPAADTFMARVARLECFRAGKPGERNERTARKRVPKDQD